MTKFRDHRGSLAESMETVQEFETKTELVKHLNKNLIPPIFESQLRIDPYGFDHRISWETHIVTVENVGCFGFTDGPL